jgi:DNA mismatch endonuclease (patch repair protein)
MDILSKEKRSWNMSRIKGKDTGPEVRVRSLLHRMGYRFRIHKKDLPGKPDIVLPKYRTAIFVHGCFWHRHEGCRKAYNPKSRRDFWEEKFRQNKSRDIKNMNLLREQDWNVIVIWECEINDESRLSERLTKEIQSASFKF